MDTVPVGEATGLAHELERAAGRPLAIRRVPIAALHLDPANARSHGERNMDAIQASLARFGQAEPLVVQEGTGRVIGGNARLQAMQRLGWTECDVVELDLSSIDATALGIALNRTAELAGWDEPVLAELLGALRAEDGLDGVGFSMEEIDELIERAEGNSARLVEDPGPEPPPENPVARLGDLWLLGDHRLLCGDSTSPVDLSRVMAGDRAVLFSTDPPYCVNYTGKDRPIHDGKPSGKDWTHVYREVDIEDLGAFLDQVFVAALPHLAVDAPIYLWHAHVQQPTIAAVFVRHGLLLHQVIVWTKPTGVFGHSYYQWQHEPCAFGWQKGHKPTHGVGQLTTVWPADWDGKARFSTFHPTSKPTRLFEIPMEQHTRARAIVLEPFSGSGSQILAAEKLGRRCRAVELQPAFVDGTILRWQKATEKTAVLEETGKSYTEMASERGVA